LSHDSADEYKAKVEKLSVPGKEGGRANSERSTRRLEGIETDDKSVGEKLGVVESKN